MDDLMKARTRALICWHRRGCIGLGASLVQILTRYLVLLHNPGHVKCLVSAFHSMTIHISSSKPIPPDPPPLPQTATILLQQNNPFLPLQLLQPPHPHLYNLTNRILMLTPHRLNLSIPPLRLLLHRHRLILHPYYSYSTLIQSLV